MPLEKRPDRPPRTIKELLTESERWATRAINVYGTGKDGTELALAAASISQALGLLAIARTLKDGGGLPQAEMPAQTLNTSLIPGQEGE